MLKLTLLLAILWNSSLVFANQSHVLTCSDVFKKISYSESEVLQLKKMNDLNAEVKSIFSEDSIWPLKSEQIREHFFAKLQELYDNLESLLESHQIPYTKHSIDIKDNKLNEKLGLNTITYFTYELRLPKSVLNENAALIKGILIHRKLSEIRIILDPLISLVRPNFNGFYNPSNNHITVNYVSFFTRAMGISNVLRHEVKHALEESKLRRGESTLAAFEFINPTALDKSYDRYFRLDELESHLLDLDFIIKKLKTTNHFLPPDFNKRLLPFKEKELIKKIILLEMLFQKAKKGLNIFLETSEDSSISFDFFEKNLAHNLGIITFKNIISTDYPTVRFSSQKLNPKDIQAQIPIKIEWALHRISQLEKRFLELKEKLKSTL